MMIVSKSKCKFSLNMRSDTSDGSISSTPFFSGNPHKCLCCPFDLTIVRQPISELIRMIMLGRTWNVHLYHMYHIIKSYHIAETCDSVFQHLCYLQYRTHSMHWPLLRSFRFGWFFHTKYLCTRPENPERFEILS